MSFVCAAKGFSGGELAILSREQACETVLSTSRMLHHPPACLPAALQQWLGSSLVADPQHQGRLVWTFDVHGAQVRAGQVDGRRYQKATERVGCCNVPLTGAPFLP